MKIEISAGGVIVKKTQIGWDVLVISDMNKQWTFPKGLIEKGEDKLTAAKREIAEEVGIQDVVFLSELPTIRYTYKRNGLISKVVHYFLFQSAHDGKLIPQKEEGIGLAQWMPIEEAIQIIGYSETNTSLLLAAKKILAEKA